MESKELVNLRDEVTCPVCLEIPRSGDLLQCPNGHLICEKDYEALPTTEVPKKTCPQCRCPYGPVRAVRSKLAVAILDVMPLPCRFSERGCEVEQRRKPLGLHERTCFFRLMNCRYAKQGCKGRFDEELLSGHEENCPFRPQNCRHSSYGCTVQLPQSLLKKHEDYCNHLPYPCPVKPSCTSMNPLSSIIPTHLKSDHPGLDRQQVGKDGRFTRAFNVEDESAWEEVGGGRREWKGSLVTFEDRAFYLGLSRRAPCGSWQVRVHILERTEVAAGYRVELRAYNPQEVGRRVTYDGPVNSMETLLGERPSEAWIGLNFPDRVAEDLINVHARSKKRVLGILGRLVEDKSF